jgi:lysophospholipase L1-like esterase
MLLALGVGNGAAPHRYYVAIGASQALGYQPKGPGVQRPTSEGYTDDVVGIERARWAGLHLVRFACPGLRVDMALSGRTTNPPGSAAGRTTSGRCRRRSGSEVGTASQFVRSHPGQVVLVTVDLGYPDVASCVSRRAIDPACVAAALTRVRSDLPVVVSRLRAAGGRSLRIVGLDHEDPYLGYFVGASDADPRFAVASARVVGRLNRVVNAAYASVDVPVAEVGAAFTNGAVTPVHLRRWGTVPLEVKRICALTWVCTDRNPHPNARGYRRIAAAVAARVAG